MVHTVKLVIWVGKIFNILPKKLEKQICSTNFYFNDFRK